MLSEMLHDGNAFRETGGRFLFGRGSRYATQAPLLELTGKGGAVGLAVMC